jgi:hypothetical protein
MLAQLTHRKLKNSQHIQSRAALPPHELNLRVLDLTVELLIARSSLEFHWAQGYEDAAQLLTAAPFRAEEEAIADQHLRNARLYSQIREFGAAAFELRTLGGSLQRL